MKRGLTLSVFIIFAAIIFTVIYSVPAQENCMQFTRIHGSINVDNANIKVIINNETAGEQLSQAGSYAVGLDNTNIPENGYVVVTLMAAKQGYVSFTGKFNISCGSDLEKNVTLLLCDFNGDRVIIHDYDDLMFGYKCFLGVNENCGNYYRNWNLIKREYDCFAGN